MYIYIHLHAYSQVDINGKVNETNIKINNVSLLTDV